MSELTSSSSAAAYNARRNRSVPSPRVTTTSHGCELHHDGVRYTVTSIRWITSSGTAFDVNARQLRAAHDMLDAMGVEAFADRARRELLVTGKSTRKRSVDTRDELTAQERQVARLARDGLSNPEIGTRLFNSRRTVEYYLQLHRALGSDPRTVDSD